MLNPSYDAVDPLTLDELAAALAAIGGFERRPIVALAVSGGPDSLALMLQADRWARQQGGVAWGLTVDHGLRPESAAEAGTVAGWLSSRGIPHRILVWQGAKPASGVQAAAREARYRLLAGWCRAQGVLHLLTAHHREDQVETYLIRRRAGSGPRWAGGDVGGARTARLPPGTAAAAVPRGSPRGIARGRGPAIPRRSEQRQPRLRTRPPPSGADREKDRRLPAGRPAGSPADPSLSGFEDAVAARRIHIRAIGEQRIAREGALDVLLGRAVALHPAGFAALDTAAIASAEPRRHRAAAGAGRGLHWRVHAIRRGATGLPGWARDCAAPGRARTLGGCRFVPWRGQMLVIRELAAASPPRTLAAGRNRRLGPAFRANLPAHARGPVTLGYLGQRGAGSPSVIAAMCRVWSIPSCRRSGTRRPRRGAALGYRRHGIEVSPWVFVSARQPAFTSRLYSCLMAGASYVSLGAETSVRDPRAVRSGGRPRR